MWDGPIFLKISVPHPSMTPYSFQPDPSGWTVTKRCRICKMRCDIVTLVLACVVSSSISWLWKVNKTKLNFMYAKANLLRKYENYSSWSFLCFSLRGHSCVKFHSRIVMPCIFSWLNFQSGNFRLKQKFPSINFYQ
jgi:hypothetical protein